MNFKPYLFLLSLAASPWLQASDSLRLSDVLNPLPEIDHSIPTPRDIVNLEVGERHWRHDEIIRYLDALAEASPRMVVLGEHARSYGGRPLVTYAISSAKNIERLAEIKAARASIINPEATQTPQPAVLHMMYSIHGNEPSGSNSTPLVAYYLNAAEDPLLLRQLESVVIIFNPMQNPDGLDRFANWSNNHRGLHPGSNPNDREHRETFPNGRTNYYWFDLNRDWLPHQHPESQGRLRVFHEWKPNVQLDFHEQGSNSSFFFMPGKPERTHPLTPALNQKLTNQIADFHRRSFDQAGSLYFSEEGYDDFFMGKGSTYADLFGSVGILFEQPSSRGARQATSNGLLTFPQTIANQFRASLSSIEATAALKDELLAYQRNFYLAKTKKSKSRTYYLATASGDATRLREFVRILKGHEIEVMVLTKDFNAGGKQYLASNSIAIPAEQTQSAYLQAIWQRQTKFKENLFYDVSTWTLPLAFNLVHTETPVRGIEAMPITDTFFDKPQQLDDSRVGYLIDWRDSASASLLYNLLEAGTNVRVATRPFTAIIEGGAQREFGHGTLFVSDLLDAPISPESHQALVNARANGVPVYAAASSHTPIGIDLGSRDFKVLSLPRVLAATGPEASAYRAGEIWHLLDQRIQMPLTMVDTNRLASVDLAAYTHILLTSPAKSMKDPDIAKLKAFTTNGGIIWAQGASTIRWLADNKLTTAAWRKTDKEKAEEQQKKAADSTVNIQPERRPFSAAKDDRALEQIRGAILKTSLDITHPVGYGMTEEVLPVFRRGHKFLEPAINPYATPLLYAAEPLMSGYISDANKQLAAGSASVVIDQQGKGAVVQVMDQMTFRAFWWGTQRVLTNVIFFGDLLEEP